MNVFINYQIGLDILDTKTRYIDNKWRFGFTFNPSLRRKRDYEILPGGYMGTASKRILWRSGGWYKELILSWYYKKIGYVAAQFADS